MGFVRTRENFCVNQPEILSSWDHTWVEAQEQLTLGDLLEQVSGKDYLELHVGVKIGKDEHSPTLKFFCKKKKFPTYLPIKFKPVQPGTNYLILMALSVSNLM